MIDAQRKVTVLLTSGSLVTSSRYEITIGSAEDNQLKLKRIKGNLAADLLVKNVTGPLKENEMRSFWIEVETDRVVFGSGEVVCLTEYMISFLQERNYLVDISYLSYGCCDTTLAHTLVYYTPLNFSVSQPIQPLSFLFKDHRYHHPYFRNT